MSGGGSGRGGTSWIRIGLGVRVVDMLDGLFAVRGRGIVGKEQRLVDDWREETTPTLGESGKGDTAALSGLAGVVGTADSGRAERGVGVSSWSCENGEEGEGVELGDDDDR